MQCTAITCTMRRDPQLHALSSHVQIAAITCTLRLICLQVITDGDVIYAKRVEHALWYGVRAVWQPPPQLLTLVPVQDVHTEAGRPSTDVSEDADMSMLTAALSRMGETGDSGDSPCSRSARPARAEEDACGYTPSKDDALVEGALPTHLVGVAIVTSRGDDAWEMPVQEKQRSARMQAEAAPPSGRTRAQARVAMPSPKSIPAASQPKGFFRVAFKGVVVDQQRYIESDETDEETGAFRVVVGAMHTVLLTSYVDLQTLECFPYEVCYTARALHTHRPPIAHPSPTHHPPTHACDEYACT